MKERIEKEMQQDPNQRESIREAKLKMKDFIERHAKKARITPEAGDRETDDKMRAGDDMEADNSGDAADGTPMEDGFNHHSAKRKADDSQAGEGMDIMYACASTMMK